jgi:glyoxylase-like metal-dependent hydrolase (beta-lactamase superfamily II)
MAGLASVLAVAFLAACAAPGGPSAATVATAAPVQVAPGVYVVRGAAGEASADNLGRIGNAGFIVGRDGVIAIDSGTSHRHGRLLLEAIASVTDKPVRGLVLTHTRQEFLFGATAFRERGVPIHMQSRAARLMAARCERCLRTLVSQHGEAEMAGSAVITVDDAFDVGPALASIGRPVRVLHFGHSSGPGDSVVLDEATGVLFAGGLLDLGHVPDVQDSDLPGWHRALDELRRLPLRQIVPGHGEAAPVALIDRVDRYLRQLEQGAAALLQSGTSLRDVPDLLELAEFKDWSHYDSTHRRNASIVFLRLEQAQLAQ